MRLLNIFGILFLTSSLLYAQYLPNPSFEGAGIDNEPPVNWPACNGSPDNPPLPEEILVELPASDGERYLSMRARGYIENECCRNYRGVRDMVSAQLLQPLRRDVYYSLSIDLATDYEVVLFDIVTEMHPIQIRLWAGNDYCDTVELLASSGPIENTEWEQFNICFSPKLGDYNYFFLEADYIDHDTTNGMILADNLVIHEFDQYDTNHVVLPDAILGTKITLEASPADEYSWNPDENLSCSDCRNPTLTVTEDMTYIVQLMVQGGCKTYESYSIHLPTCDEIQSWYITPLIDTVIEYRQEVKLTAPYGETFIWSPTDFLDCQNCQTNYARPEVPITYICQSTDQIGCVITYSFEIGINLHVPNVITPNFDGYNDNFIVPGLPENSRLKIIDRTGVLIFETDNYQNNWPETALPTLPNQTDTYWFLLECQGLEPIQDFILVKF
ncbi:MAG: gliding motility-associated C-terminal domain-containing protein [Bacteroidales bacterium]|nr:gliding motility-associated C-terminal domain-containing protein [Bacteroidales bacterium]